MCFYTKATIQERLICFQDANLSQVNSSNKGTLTYSMPRKLFCIFSFAFFIAFFIYFTWCIVWLNGSNNKISYQNQHRPSSGPNKKSKFN